MPADKNTILVKIDGEIRGLMSKLDKSTKGLRKFGDSAFRLSRRMAIGAAAAGAAVIGLAKAFGDFEESFTTVTTLLTKADFERFGSELKTGALSVMQEFGFTVQDTNKALFDAISAGVEAGRATDFLREASRLAVGGATSLGIAVDGLTTILNAYGLQIDDAATVSNAFYTAQKFGKTTVAELSVAIGNVVPIARAAGIGFDELLSAMALMTKKGIATDRAATALRGAISALVKPSKQAEAILRRLGVPVGATELKAKGLGAALVKLNEAVMANGDVLAQAIPNVRAFAGLASLTGDALSEYGDILNEVRTDTESLDAATQRQMETFNRQVGILRAKLTVAAIKLGEVMIPVLSKIVKGLGELADKIAGLSEPQKEWIAKALLITTAVLALGAALALIVGVIAKAAAGMIIVITVLLTLTKTFAILTGNILLFNAAVFAIPLVGWIALAITAIGLLAIAWKTNFGGMRDATKRFVDNIRKFFEAMVLTIMKLLAKLPAFLGGDVFRDAVAKFETAREEAAVGTIGAREAEAKGRDLGVVPAAPVAFGEVAPEEETKKKREDAILAILQEAADVTDIFLLDMYARRLNDLEAFEEKRQLIENFYQKQREQAAKDLGIAVKEDMVEAILTGQNALEVGTKTFADNFKRILVEEAFAPIAIGAQNLAKALLKMIPSGFMGGFFGLFQGGSNFVPHNMLAGLHRGEMVIPKVEADKMRRGEAGGEDNRTINIIIEAGQKDPRELWEELQPYAGSAFIRNKRGVVGAS